MAYVPSSLLFGICLIIFMNIISVVAGAPPNEVALALQPRATFSGGYALSEQQCPSGTTSCGGGSHSCCPANTACFSGAVSEFCCPSESDCTPTVKSFPVCADPSWVLYNGKVTSEHFCCQAGEQGIHPGPNVGGVGLCVVSDMSVAVTQTAFEYTSASGSSLSASGLVSSTGISSAPVSNSALTSTAETSATQSTSVQSSVIQTTTAQSSTVSTSASASSKSSGSGGSINLLAEIAVVKAIGAIGFWLMVYL